MDDNPSMNSWRRAYDLARQIRDQAPWRWMYDLDNFGFEHPDSGEHGFISVMGHEEEHFGIAVYRGVINFFKLLQYAGNPATQAADILEIEAVHLSFEDRDKVEPQDRKVMKELGLRFRGNNAWPLFRSYRPASVSWFVNSEELDLLTTGLERLLEVGPIWKDKQTDKELTAAGQERRYLMCIPEEQDGRIVWTQQLQTIEDDPIEHFGTCLDKRKIMAAFDLPTVTNKLELSMELMPRPVQEDEDVRPYFPYLMLLVKAESGYIVARRLAIPQPTWKACYEQLAPFLLDSMLENQIVPEEIFVRTDTHATMLEPLTEQLPIIVTVKPTLPRSEDAMTAFMNLG